MAVAYTRSLPPSVLMEIYGTLDGSGRYFSDWADVSGYRTARVWITAPGLDSATVTVSQGFPFTEPGTPNTNINQALTAASDIASAEIDIYQRALQVWVLGATASQPITISVQGVN